MLSQTSFPHRSIQVRLLSDMEGDEDDDDDDDDIENRNTDGDGGGGGGREKGDFGRDDGRKASI